jgi:plastocyanin
MRKRTLTIVAAFAVLIGCSNSPTYGGGGGGGGGHSTTITVGNDLFTPTPDTVAAGQVTFTWSAASHGHTLKWDSGPGTLPADSGSVASPVFAGSVVRTLVAGTYQYHCQIHGGVGTGMHGTIVVQ